MDAEWERIWITKAQSGDKLAIAMLERAKGKQEPVAQKPEPFREFDPDIDDGLPF